MGQIRIDKVIKTNNKIQIEFSFHDIDEFFLENNMISEYDCNIEKVPTSIAIIPFVANIMPICFIFNIDLIGNDIDKSFFDSISKYRTAYQKMIPSINMGGNFAFSKFTENNYSPKKSCLMYSGGIDATNSLCNNISDIDDCISVWGADIKYNNNQGWKTAISSIQRIVSCFNKKLIIIKSNFREILNQSLLDIKIRSINDNWWHAVQHGIALLGQVAPLAFLNEYKIIYIASSFTKEYHPICASDPTTDTCFNVGNTITIHDGYEFNRSQKIKNIFCCMNKYNIDKLPLHVCWESDTGKNCGKCEKCIRSYLNCISEKCDPMRLNLQLSISTKQLISFCKHKIQYNDDVGYRYAVIKSSVRKNYDICEIKNNKLLYWIYKFDPQKNDKSIYWKIKRLYHRVKSLL